MSNDYDSDETNKITDSTVEQDIEFVRNSYYKLITHGNEALEEMMDVARSTEHPRAYEVLSNMFKHVSELNGNLLDLHKKRKELNKEEANNLIEKNNTTNNLFIGSTAELQKMLAKADKEKNEAYKQEIIDVTPEEE